MLYGFFRNYTVVNMGSHWTRREPPYFSNQRRRATRMRAYSENVFFSTSLGNVEMRTWAEGCSFGFDFGDDLPPLLDLRFADAILIFARTSHEIMTLMNKLVEFLGDAGLKLNAGKTVLITTQAQPPPF